jgi:hypothetical protein
MKKSTAAGLAFATAALVAAARKGKPTLAKKALGKSPTILGMAKRSHSDADRIAERTAERYMMYVIMPAWSAAGALDWLWHRQTKIQTTSGVKESLTHQLMMIEAGVPVFAGLFLEANAGLFSLLTGGMLLHQFTAIWDVDYTVSRRKVPAREQHTHTFMETIPFDIWAVLACLRPKQFLSMLGMGPEKPVFRLRLKRPPLPIRKITAIFGATTLFVALPHIEEFWRCLRAHQRGLTETDTPECARELYAS